MHPGPGQQTSSLSDHWGSQYSASQPERRWPRTRPPLGACAPLPTFPCWLLAALRPAAVSLCSSPWHLACTSGRCPWLQHLSAHRVRRPPRGSAIGQGAPRHPHQLPRVRPPQARASRRVAVPGLPDGTPTFLIRTELEQELPRGVGWASRPPRGRRRTQSRPARLGSGWSLRRATTFWRSRSSPRSSPLSARCPSGPRSQSLAETWKNFCNAPNLNW